MFFKDPFTGDPSLAFTMYALECEGVLDTVEGKKNRIIKNLRQRGVYELIDEATVNDEAAAAGLYTLTDTEINNILIQVRGY